MCRRAARYGPLEAPPRCEFRRRKWAARHMKWLASIVAIAVALFGSGAAAEDIPAQARAALAPTGKLRVALLPLPHMALRDQVTGQFTGVIVDLGRELAKRLDVPVEFAAGKLERGRRRSGQKRPGGCDIPGWLAGLAAQIDFGAPYIGYETSFLVPANSAIRGLDDIDAPGRRIIVPEKSAIERSSDRHSRTSELIGMPIAIGSAQRVVEMLKNGEADAYSNLTHLLSLTQPTYPNGELCLEAT